MACCQVHRRRLLQIDADANIRTMIVDPAGAGPGAGAGAGAGDGGGVDGGDGDSDGDSDGDGEALAEALRRSMLSYAEETEQRV